MKTRNYGWTILTLLVIIGFCVAYIVENQTQSVTGVSVFKVKAASLSKAAIVREMNQLANEVARLEKNGGISGRRGVIVYSPQTTAKLLALFQELDLRLLYLNSGKLPHNPGGWQGYSLDKANAKPYSPAQALKVMNELEVNGVPANLVKQFHIFLLPNSIHEVSGLGGTGFSLISAPLDSGKFRSGVEAELAVTLDHEIGHHIHMSFMPKGTASGEKNWREYLALRGGVWRDSGQVNTVAWSNSSEETFAEDFRMLFGKDQPYFGDVTLGDPRVDPKQARNLKNFFIELGKQQPKQEYISPWIPAEMDLVFWNQQESLLALMWVGLGVMGFANNRTNTPHWQVLNG